MQLKAYTLINRRMHCYLINFTYLLSSVLLFRKLLFFEFFLDMSERVAPVSNFQVKMFLLVDALQLLTLFVRMLMCFERKFAFHMRTV
jgi:hypothetical protein